MISESDLSPQERYDLFKRLKADPTVQAAHLRDKIVTNMEVENRWNNLIAVIDDKLKSLDSVSKIVPHNQLGQPLLHLADEIDLRGVLRKALFDKKQRLIADRDRELSQL